MFVVVPGIFCVWFWFWSLCSGLVCSVWLWHLIITFCLYGHFVLLSFAIWESWLFFFHCFLDFIFVFCLSSIVRTGIQWTSLFCVYFVMCGLITRWPSEFNISIHRLIGDIFFVTQCFVTWAVIWWNLSSVEHLHFLIYPKCTFVRTTAFSLLSMNNYTVL